MISKMAIKKCSVCGKEFKCSPSGRKSTCSPDCYAKARQIKMESRYIGKRYGHLIINAVCRENGKTWAMCLCDCGNTQRIDVQALQHGQKACSRDCPYCKTGYKTPPAHVRKAILYSLNAVREDLMAAELYAQIQSGLISPDSTVDIERDGYDRIIDWRNSNNKISISYQMEDGGEIQSLDTLRFGEQMKAKDALQEMYLRMPYLLEDEIAELYPDD